MKVEGEEKRGIPGIEGSTLLEKEMAFEPNRIEKCKKKIFPMSFKIYELNIQPNKGESERVMGRMRKPRNKATLRAILRKELW